MRQTHDPVTDRAEQETRRVEEHLLLIFNNNLGWVIAWGEVFHLCLTGRV